MFNLIPETFRPRYLYDLLYGAANQAGLVTVYSLLIFSTSVFIYITIYSTYVPVVQHTRPVHLQFDSACKKDCELPFAVIDFNNVRSSVSLARGQSYRFVISLEVPESDINWDQGMFMIRLRLIESQGKTLYDISRPAILRYKTFLTRLIYSLTHWPLLVTNYRNEKQTMNVQLIDDYIEGARFYFNKMDRALIELQARDLQVYSASLHVIANLSGLSYYMYHWPLSSAILGVATLSGFMAILSVYRSHSSSSYRAGSSETDQFTGDCDDDDYNYDKEDGVEVGEDGSEDDYGVADSSTSKKV